MQPKIMKCDAMWPLHLNFTIMKHSITQSQGLNITLKWREPDDAWLFHSAERQPQIACHMSVPAYTRGRINEYTSQVLRCHSRMQLLTVVRTSGLNTTWPWAAATDGRWQVSGGGGVGDCRTPSPLTGGLLAALRACCMTPVVHYAAY